MPAGDLVVEPFQLEFRLTLMGNDSPYRLDKDRGGMDGLIDVAVKMTKTEWRHAPGAFIGESFEASRTATIALLVKGSTADAAGVDTVALRSIWTPSTAEEPLYFWLPGWGKCWVNGWSGGALFFPSLAIHGLIPVMATFEITDPEIYS